MCSLANLLVRTLFINDARTSLHPSLHVFMSARCQSVKLQHVACIFIDTGLLAAVAERS